MSSESTTTDVAYGRRLFTAFAAMAFAFIASTLFTSWRSSRIETETHTLLTNALPSLDHLVAASDLVRDLEATSDDYPDLATEAQAAARLAIERDRRSVDTELMKYLETPYFDGERPLYADVPLALREFDRGLAHLFDQVAAHDQAGARITADREVRSTAMRVAMLLQRLVKFNAAHAYTAVNQIEATRQATHLTAIGLDALSVLLGIAAGIRVWRLFRVHTNLMRQHGEIVERRADELELFGKRVAHDLLSPLSALTYCLTAFKRASESDPSLKDAMVRARACVKRAQTMVDGIFEFARSGGRPDTNAHADVGEIVEEVVAEAREAETADRPEMIVEPFEPCTVSCSRGVLFSIMSNLVRNGAKFMSDSALKRVTIRVGERGDAVHIEVEDTGPGVPSGLETAIFEPYVRAEGVTQPGLGLGLATVKRLCESLGGTVHVHSSSRGGAVFAVTLPKASGAATADALESGRIAVRVS